MFPHPPKSDSNNLPELFLTFNNYGTLPETRGRSDGQMDRLTDMRAYRAAIAAKILSIWFCKKQTYYIICCAFFNGFWKAVCRQDQNLIEKNGNRELFFIFNSAFLTIYNFTIFMVIMLHTKTQPPNFLNSRDRYEEDIKIRTWKTTLQYVKLFTQYFF